MLSHLFSLVRLLSDGAVHSGESIADQLSISRTAVWKKIKKLMDLGIEIDSVRGSGYRMLKPFDILEQDSLLNRLTPAASALFQYVEFLEVVDSTNNHVLNGLNNSSMPYACFAECQTSGRGRRGRGWHSPLGNIACSIAWSFEQGVVATEGLSLLVGLAVVKALETEGIIGAKLKWPNDVLLNESKLAGILLEMSGEPQGLCHVVIGIGINVALPNVVESINQPFISLFDINQSFSRNRLCAQLLNQLALMMPEFSEEGFEPFCKEWSRYDAYADQAVQLVSGDRRQVGVAKGVNNKGALLLSCQNNIKEIYAGELSLRLLDDS